jgi:hypothetical protein
MNDLTSDQRTVLQAFSRALSKEAHVLTQHPELMWQQMYNRLRWGGGGGEAGVYARVKHVYRVGSHTLGANNITIPGIQRVTAHHRWSC